MDIMSEISNLAIPQPTLTTGRGEGEGRVPTGEPGSTKEFETALATEIVSGTSKVRYSAEGKIYHACKKCTCSESHSGGV